MSYVVIDNCLVGRRSCVSCGRAGLALVAAASPTTMPTIMWAGFSLAPELGNLPAHRYVGTLVRRAYVTSPPPPSLQPHLARPRAGPSDLLELNGWTSAQMLRRYAAGTRSARARRSCDRIMREAPLTEPDEGRRPMRSS